MYYVPNRPQLMLVVTVKLLISRGVRYEYLLLTSASIAHQAGFEPAT